MFQEGTNRVSCLHSGEDQALKPAACVLISYRMVCQWHFWRCQCSLVLPLCVAQLAGWRHRIPMHPDRILLRTLSVFWGDTAPKRTTKEEARDNSRHHLNPKWVIVVKLIAELWETLMLCHTVTRFDVQQGNAVSTWLRLIHSRR